MKRDCYNVEDGEVERENPTCPKCGEGVLLAEHGDRKHCGNCGYTKYQKKEE